MIPCYSLFLEVEIPDPSLNYFIINQNRLDNTEKLLAPPPIGTPTSVAFTPRATDPFNTYWNPDVNGTGPLPNDILGFPIEVVEAIPAGTSLNETATGAWLINYDDTGNAVKHGYSDNAPNGTTQPGFYTQFRIAYQHQEETRRMRITLIDPSSEFYISTDAYNRNDNTFKHGVLNIAFYEVVDLEDFQDFDVRVQWFGSDNVTLLEEQTWNMSKSGYNPDGPVDPPPPENCESGLNTFVLNASCLDGEVDLLEGWGSAKPDYLWVDVITDTTDVQIQRGFDMKQGIVGSPIAGIMEAEVLDPYLDGLSTQLVAVGQRVRLRAGNQIVFSGQCNSVRSEYDAINTPILRIEAVDALGLLNAQMVEARPAENYNTRIAEAASKVELPIFQQDSLTELTPTEDAKSALELLIETQDSEGSIVWLDRFGALYSTNRYWLDNIEIGGNTRAGAEPRFVFTNNPISDEEQNLRFGNTLDQVCLSAYRQVADTTQVINGCTFYNYTEEDDVDFEGLPIKTIVRDTKTYESSTSRRLYGDAGVKLTTYLPGDGPLNEYAEFIFANYDTPKTKVETLQFPLDRWDTLAVPETVSLDIGEPLEVRIDDPNSGSNLTDAVQRIAQIRHRINPQEWLCELDLL
jgi:hypothetical protein